MKLIHCPPITHAQLAITHAIRERALSPTKPTFSHRMAHAVRTAPIR